MKRSSEDTPFAAGARTVKQAVKDTGLSQGVLWDLMNENIVRWVVHGGNRTRLLSWSDLTAYLDGEYAEQQQAKAK